jgi:uncharacterized protein YjbJ (UPF0337 family)
MDKKKLEGKKEEVVGHVKEGAGGLTGNRDLEAEGQDEQAKAKVSKGLGDVREGAKDYARQGQGQSSTTSTGASRRRTAPSCQPAGTQP